MSSVASVQYTEGKTYTFRLHVLLCDIGSLVFRKLIIRLINPDNLATRLTRYKSQLSHLNGRDYNALYPERVAVTSTEAFDISLLTIILREVCELKWDSRRNVDADWNIVSRIKGITQNRNALFHDYDTQFCRPDGTWTEEEIFDYHWNKTKEALIHLDDGKTTDLQKNIDSLKTDPIDPTREEKFNSERAKWLEQQHNNIYSLAELLNGDLEDKIFVKTEQFRKAEEKLSKDRIVILKGNPGEGKSITARMLAREVDDEKKWLNISSHIDWRSVNVEQHNVIIDDIFGASALDAEEFKKWRKYMKEVEVAVQNGQLHVIITSRNYILNEALQKMHYPKIFAEENTIQLSSEALSISERYGILDKHLRKKANGNSLSQDEMNRCTQCTSRIESKFMFQIGFPECARLFCQNDTLFAEKDNFFNEPLYFLKNLLRDIFEQDDKTFLAYFLIWSQNNQILSVKDIEQPISLTPRHILGPIEKLQFDPGERLRTISRTLESNKDGFLFFDRTKGEYKFSHNVIADVVGLLSFERNPTAALACSSYDFTMRFISTSIQKLGVDNIYFAPYRYDQLSARLVEYMVIRENQILNGAAISHEAFRTEAFCREFIAHTSEKKQLQEILSVPVHSVFAEFAQYRVELKYDNSFLPSYSLLKGKNLFMMMCFKGNLIPKIHLASERYLCTLIACKFGQTDILKYLFDTGTKLSSEMVIVAGNEGKNDALEFFTKYSHDDYYENLPGWKTTTNPLIGLIRQRSMLAVQILLERHPILHNLQWKNARCTALHLACDYGASDIAEMIRKRHSELDTSNKMGFHPIHVAVTKQNAETVKVLLNGDFKNQASKKLTLEDKPNISGAGLLHIAVWKYSKSVVDVLTEHDYFSREVDDLNRTAFVFALNGGKANCIEHLLDIENINKEIPDAEGNTPLHIAVLKVGDDPIYAKCVRNLCKYVDVNKQNKLGNTPLHLAYYYNKAEILNDLLEAPSINQNVVNKQGKTPKQLIEHLIEDYKEEDEEG